MDRSITFVVSVDSSAMKITLEIRDPLLREARKLAARERTTLRALVERGLRRVVAEGKRKPAFPLREASFRGRGLRAEFRDLEWQQLRELVYPDVMTAASGKQKPG